MVSMIQASPALSSSSLLSALSRKAQPRKRSVYPLFSLESLSRKCTFLAASVHARRGFSYKEEDFASPSDLSIEGPLKIVEYPDPRLRARNKRINIFDETLKKLANEMFDVMYRTDGIGLSAPQVGMNIQLMVFNPAGERGDGEEIVLANPVVYKASKKTLLYNEGCLSFPGIYADIERPASVKIDARDITGARFRVNLSGLPARIFQHEFDHIQGSLFFDRMTEEVLDNIRSELMALEKKYEDLTGQSSPEKIDNYKQRKQFAGFART